MDVSGIVCITSGYFGLGPKWLRTIGPLVGPAPSSPVGDYPPALDPVPTVDRESLDRQLSLAETLTTALFERDAEPLLEHALAIHPPAQVISWSSLNRLRSSSKAAWETRPALWAALTSSIRLRSQAKYSGSSFR